MHARPTIMKRAELQQREALGTSIMLVDDSPAMRAALQGLLAKAFPGIAIYHAPDGRSALEIARRHRPRVILMDINLPDTNGIVLTRTVLALLPAARVIMVTLHATSPYIELARAAGAFGYVVKERVAGQLLPLVRHALEGTASPPGREADT